MNTYKEIAMKTVNDNYGQIKGPIVMIGFGSIGKGTLPLIERHFTYNKNQMVVIDPSDADRKLLDERGIKFLQLGFGRNHKIDDRHRARLVARKRGNA